MRGAEDTGDGGDRIGDLLYAGGESVTSSYKRLLKNETTIAMTPRQLTTTNRSPDFELDVMARNLWEIKTLFLT
jgi:hypothetical protein